MASSLGAAGRVIPQQCGRTPLGNKRQRHNAAPRVGRRQNVAVAAEGNGSNGSSNGSKPAWDNISVDELQEWEVGGADRCRSATLLLPQQACRAGRRLVRPLAARAAAPGPPA